MLRIHFIPFVTKVYTLYSLLFSGNYDTGRALFILLVISPVSPCPLEIMVFDEKRRQKPLRSYTYSGISNRYIVMIYMVPAKS